MRIKIIDPPSGWMYGFPRQLPEGINTDEELRTWLVGMGYPEKDIELALKYSRYWDAEIKDA